MGYFYFGDEATKISDSTWELWNQTALDSNLGRAASKPYDIIQFLNLPISYFPYMHLGIKTEPVMTSKGGDTGTSLTTCLAQ